MKNMKEKNCKGIRQRIFDALVSRLSLDADWVRGHIANCPRCQRRLAAAGRVDLALTILKSEPHSLDLLRRANSQAIGVLKHSLRTSDKAEKLKNMIPMPKLYEKCKKYQSSVLNAAACIMILAMFKAGVFKGIETFKETGSAVVKNYYVTNAGQDISDEIFSS